MSSISIKTNTNERRPRHMVLPLSRLHDVRGERSNVPRWGAALYEAETNKEHMTDKDTVFRIIPEGELADPNSFCYYGWEGTGAYAAVRRRMSAEKFVGSEIRALMEQP